MNEKRDGLFCVGIFLDQDRITSFAFDKQPRGSNWGKVHSPLAESWWVWRVQRFSKCFFPELQVLLAAREGNERPHPFSCSIWRGECHGSPNLPDILNTAQDLAVFHSSGPSFASFGKFFFFMGLWGPGKQWLDFRRGGGGKRNFCARCVKSAEEESFWVHCSCLEILLVSSPFASGSVTLSLWWNLSPFKFRFIPRAYLRVCLQPHRCVLIHAL